MPPSIISKSFFLARRIEVAVVAGLDDVSRLTLGIAKSHVFHALADHFALGAAEWFPRAAFFSFREGSTSTFDIPEYGQLLP